MWDHLEPGSKNGDKMSQLADADKSGQWHKFFVKIPQMTRTTMILAENWKKPCKT